MSYRKKHIKNKIQKIRPKKSIFKKKWFWIVALVLLTILFAFYFFLFYPGVQVKDIIISGNQKVASEDIKSLILDNINSKLIGVGSWTIDSKSLFLVNSGKLEKELLDKFPAIESIKINRKFMQTLEFQINERLPVAVFCSSLISGQGNCYFMDNNGTIFESLSAIPQDTLIVRQLASDAQIFTGEKVVQQDIINLILKVEENLKDNFQIDLKEALVASPVRLNVNTNENWQIYFDTSSNTDLQITKLNLLLSSEITASQRKNLRYINLIPSAKAIICDNKTCGG